MRKVLIQTFEADENLTGVSNDGFGTARSLEGCGEGSLNPWHALGNFGIELGLGLPVRKVASYPTLSSLSVVGYLTLDKRGLKIFFAQPP